ncbi:MULTISPECIES: glutathione S-transferase [unclassified Variovorax]|jgi:glutathione S-transferase|uniref:glutathione S-transferase family protein n=1 Tax=unclassified Variovorax TaxID=663243 RepID=UPI000F7F22C1|nr:MULTISPECIES: glutathione S-transferase [unclassified Variovorax]RSZ32273.1 glutathione S-transferase [Variovorax sp. 553]RSZ32565.1 glutathione S-transferase [Variovorax sp. 679]
MTATRPAQPIKLYGSAISGHVHRVRLFLTMLGLPFESIELDMRKRENRTPEFLARNPFGQVPVIEDGELTLADSNAILVYLNERYSADPSRWMPRDAVGAARVQRWFSVAAGPLAYGPAAARIIALFGQSADPTDIVKRSHALLSVMEMHLEQQPFLAGPAATLADIANYAYVARAPEGSVSLDDYPNVREWLERVESLPGFVPMVRTPVAPVVEASTS